MPYRSSGAEPPDYVYIQPTPAATVTPAAAPATAAPVPASAVTAPVPAPLSNPPASIPDRVVRELGHEADARMLKSSRGKTRAMRYSYHSMGLMSHAALAQRWATRGTFGETFREHALPKPNANLPAAPASNVPTPPTVVKAEASEHAEIWRDSRAREFSGLLQGQTFGPAEQPFRVNQMTGGLLRWTKRAGLQSGGQLQEDPTSIIISMISVSRAFVNASSALVMP